MCSVRVCVECDGASGEHATACARSSARTTSVPATAVCNVGEAVAHLQTEQADMSHRTLAACILHAVRHDRHTAESTRARRTSPPRTASHTF